jgi:hypothetical protein
VTEAQWQELLAEVEGHSPGPWDDVISTWSVRALGPGQAFGDYVCDISAVDGTGSVTPGPVARANKALIAAAPALLVEVGRLRARVAELESEGEERGLEAKANAARRES